MNQAALHLIHYAQSLWKLYRETKGELLPQEQIEKRLEICSTCNNFTGRGCVLCGCCVQNQQTHFNKLAFPTERCPKDPPEWVEVRLPDKGLVRQVDA